MKNKNTIVSSKPLPKESDKAEEIINEVMEIITNCLRTGDLIKDNKDLDPLFEKYEEEIGMKAGPGTRLQEEMLGLFF